MHIVSYPDAAANLEALMDKASADRSPILITCEGGQNVVLLSNAVWTDVEHALSINGSGVGATAG